MGNLGQRRGRERPGSTQLLTPNPITLPFLRSLQGSVYSSTPKRRKHPLVSQLLIMVLDFRRARSKLQLWSPGRLCRALKSASASPAAATKAPGSATAGSLQGTGTLLPAPCPTGTIRSPWGAFLNSQ